MTNLTKKLLCIIFVISLALPAFPQVPVIIAPPPKLQFFQPNGQPLSFGCVFTYASGTNTPLATYIDSTGTTQNANPVPLNAGGFAGGGSSGIWLQSGVAYTLKVVSQGGTNCASGQTQYTVNGIGGGGSTITTVVPYSATPAFPITGQNQLFEITLTGNAAALPLSAVGIIPPSYVTFQITQDGTGGHTFTWPSNTVGGGLVDPTANHVTTQMFVWNGTTASAVGPAIELSNLFVGGNFTASQGYFNAATGYQIAGSFGAALSCPQSTGTGTIFAPCITVPVADPTELIVNAAVTTPQVLKTTSFASQSLNYIGASFRITSQVNMDTAGGNSGIVYFSEGPTAGLANSGNVLANVPPSVLVDDPSSVTCTVKTSGATGSMVCGATSTPSVTSPASGVIVPSVQATFTSVDFTSPVYVGLTCQFAVAASANICAQELFVVERLK